MKAVVRHERCANARPHEAISGETVMRRRNKFYFSIIIFLGLIGELILLGYIAVVTTIRLDYADDHRRANNGFLQADRRPRNA
jgi:hypothetical protein